MDVQFIRNVFPGDAVPEAGRKCIGINNDKAVVAGQLCKIEDLYFIRSKTNKYNPTKFDVVIGKIFYTSPDFYKVDLGGSVGFLPVLAFLNATKRNKPELQRGDIVLCSVEKVVYGEPLLCCRKPGYGKIEDAFPLPSWKVRLLYFSNWLINAGAKYTFKISMGMNGFISISSPDASTKREIIKQLEEFN